MLADAEALGDRPPEWNRGFLENNIDGVILIAGDNAARNASELGIIKHVLEADRPNGPVREAFTLTGHVRTPKQNEGHEQYVYSRYSKESLTSHVKFRVLGRRLTARSTRH